MQQLQQTLVEIETEAEELLLAKHQVKEVAVFRLSMLDLVLNMSNFI